MEIGTSLSVYRIVAALGAGGMGEVYRARDTELQRDVAVKILPEELARDTTAMSRFRREAQLLASVNHPNIATIHGFDEADGVRFLVLELLEGQTLAERLKAGPLPVAEALEVGGQIARALEAAHKRSVIHRDLKPANVMVSPDGWVKVLDFGLAKALDVGSTPGDQGWSLSGSDSRLLTVTADQTVTGSLMGTVPYMSPEQVRRQKADRRSDVWAFGCLVFEILTGRRAFKGPTTIDTLSAILEHDPPWELLPAELGPAVRRLLVRCLQKDPERRLAAMADARITLGEALHPSPAPVAEEATPAASITTFVAGPNEVSSASLGLGPSTLSYLDTLDRYTVVERIAAGAYGEIYRAWDREEERDVALKVLRPELVADEQAREGLRREAQALSRLRHPNIAALFDFGSAEGIDFVATEYVAGTSLAARVADGALPETAVTHLGAQIATAVAEAHEAGILHRDIKTGNVLVTADGQAKLIDFGLAGATGGAVPHGPRREGLSGPLPYQAPEVLQGGEPTEASDVYSLGVVLYRMATGKWPFWGEDVQELSEAILSRPPRPPGELLRSLSPALEQLILKCLEKDPADRFPSAREVAVALRALVPATRTLPASPDRRGRRRRLVAAGVTALALVVAVLLGWRWRWELTGGSSSPLAGVESVVVMPSQLLSAETDLYLSDAIPNTISTHLSRVEELETKLPPSSLDLERVGGDLGRIAEAYGAGAMVLSTVSARGSRLVLNLRLVDAASRNILWSHEYQGEEEAYLDLARRSAEGIRQALRPDSDTFQAAPDAPARSEAELFLQQGRYYSKLYGNLGRDGDKQRAVAAFERALELDPRRADAAAEIAVLHATRLDLGVSILEILPEIRTWAERALEIDPRSSKAWAVRGYVEGGRQPESYRRKLEYLLRAATYGPRDGYAHSRLVNPLGNHSITLAMASSREASDVDPLVLISPLFEGLCLATLGQMDAGLARVDHALGIEPGMPFGWWVKGLLLGLDGRDQATLSLVAEHLDPLVAQERLHPSWAAVVRDLGTFTQASRRGDQAQVDAAAQRLVAMARGEMPFPRWQSVTTGIPGMLARQGRTEEAVELLRFRIREGIYLPYDYLLFSPELEPIRDDPRFQEDLEQSRAGFETMVAIIEEARSRDEMPAYLEQPLADLLKRIRQIRRGG
ncbi:MAG: protein kinase [bacterium]|nr:protein kinase [bacterium]